MSHRVRTGPGAGGGNLDRVCTGQGQAHRAGLVLACNHHPDFREVLMAGKVSEIRSGGGLGELRDPHHRQVLLADAALFREQGRHMRVRTHTQQKDVEPG